MPVKKIRPKRRRGSLDLDGLMILRWKGMFEPETMSKADWQEFHRHHLDGSKILCYHRVGITCCMGHEFKLIRKKGAQCVLECLNCKTPLKTDLKTWQKHEKGELKPVFGPKSGL